MLPWHGEGVCLQLFLLARAVPHLHHWDHTDQHLLPGLPGGLFLLHVVRRDRVNAARQIHPAAVGLAHRIHLLRDCHEESAVCELPTSKKKSIQFIDGNAAVLLQSCFRILAFFCRSPVCFHQLGSCAYLDSLMKNSCWLIQAFSMFCTIKGYDVRKCLLQMMIIS